MLLDTNVLVRHLTGEPPDQTRRATAFLREVEAAEMPALIVTELVDVPESVYERSRAQVAALVRSVLAFPPVAVPDQDAVLRAVELYETVSLDFAEAYLAAVAEQTDDGVVVSFDRTLDRVTTIARRES